MKVYKNNGKGLAKYFRDVLLPHYKDSSKRIGQGLCATAKYKCLENADIYKPMEVHTKVLKVGYLFWEFEREPRIK